MMKLILSLTLIWMLSSTGGALECNLGSGSGKTETCKPNQNCAAFANENDDNSDRLRGCVSGCAIAYQTISLNFGFDNTLRSVECCNTSLCNIRSPPYPDPDQKPNGLQCFICENQSDTVCNKTIQCRGVQDRCMERTGKYHNFVGCVSRNLCKAGEVMGFNFPSGTKCCESSFCNSAWTVKLNVVLLLLGLILFAVC